MVSCSKTADFKFDKNTFYVTGHDIGLTDVREIKWKVGKYGKDTVSRGIRLTFELPIIDDSDLEQLYEKRSVDSWLVRLKRRQGGRNNILGYFSLMLVSPDSRNNGKLRFRSPNKSSIGVNYAASSISMRLDELPCPALGHSYRIEDLELNKASSGSQMWVVSGGEDSYVAPKVEGISYSPVTVNGGMELEGEYSLDIAFYNAKGKRRLSSFVSLHHYAEVKKEVEQAIKGCENFTVPNRGDGDAVKKFKFKR